MPKPLVEGNLATLGAVYMRRSCLKLNNSYEIGAPLEHRATLLEAELSKLEPQEIVILDMALERLRVAIIYYQTLIPWLIKEKGLDWFEPAIYAIESNEELQQKVKEFIQKLETENA